MRRLLWWREHGGSGIERSLTLHVDDSIDAWEKWLGGIRIICRGGSQWPNW